MPHEQRAALKAAPRGPGQKAHAQATAQALQAAALEEAAAQRDSGNDFEWMAIGQQVPEGRQVQAGADDAAVHVGCDQLC